MDATSYSARAAIVAREDLVQFINACFACTGQREFYSDTPDAPRVSIAFLHEYILGNYRRLYARTLAAGINHYNQAQIILNLLATGRDTPPTDRAEENALITAALHALPTNRVWNLFAEARRRGINNRRARALVRGYLQAHGPERAAFEAVKYRGKVRSAAAHAHLPLPGELGPFLFGDWVKRRFETPLFEAFRRSHFSTEAIYELPYTVAEGMAAKHGIDRDTFLARIEGRMTAAERLRLQQSAARASDGKWELTVDLGKAALTRLCLYLLSLPAEERETNRERFTAALEESARRALRRAPLRLGKVAAVLDRSYSSSGSVERRRRPLAVALGAHHLLAQAADEYRAFWTGAPVPDPLLVSARGQTNLADALLDALEWGPELVVIVSDGCDNDPPEGAAEVIRVWRERLDPDGRTTIVHANPVFSAVDYAPLAISPWAPTVGLRDAEDLPTMLGFARFAQGAATLADLEVYLAERARGLLGTAEKGDADAGED